MSVEQPGQVPAARRPSTGVQADSLTLFVLRSVLPGFIAALLVGIGAFGVGWLPLQTSLVDYSVVDALRSTTLGAVVSKGAVVVGIALLIQAWLLLGHDVMRGYVKDVRRLWLALGAWALPRILAPPLFSRDVYSYFAQGKMMVCGVSPYQYGSSSVPGWYEDGVDPMWGEAPTPYGQFWLLLSRGVVAFTGGGQPVPGRPCVEQFTGTTPYSGALVLRLLAVIGVALLAWAVPKLAFAGGISPAKALWLGVLNPLVLMHFVSGAHNDALMIGLVVTGLALAVERMPILGVILITLGGNTKPIGLVALPFLGLIWAGPHAGKARVIGRWLMVGAIAAVILAVFAAITHTGFGWLSALSTPGAVKTWLSPPTALAMAIGDALSLVGFDITDSLIEVCRFLGMIATLVVLGYLCLKPQGRTPIRGAALAFFALVALGPVVQPWYVLWSLPLFAASGLRRTEFRVALVGIAGFTLYGLITSSSTQDSLVQIPDLVAVFIVAIVIGVVMAVSPRERRLLLGGPDDVGLVPDDPPARARAGMLVFRGSKAEDGSAGNALGRESP
ncbi:MAG: polyprenol phosphomannose-dependent alpha 1,6 mannosyltransferase MptB [Actinomycetes bacterium]